jgi:predicted transcriptional regulator
LAYLLFRCGSFTFIRCQCCLRFNTNCSCFLNRDPENFYLSGELIVNRCHRRVRVSNETLAEGEKDITMKTATIPALRVEPELRQAVEEVLNENETLSAFIELALRAGVARRRLQREFIARGLAGRDEARRTGEYADADEALGELQGMLGAVRSAGAHG